MDIRSWEEEKSAAISSIKMVRDKSYTHYQETLERVRGAADVHIQDRLRNEAVQQIAVFLEANRLYLEYSSPNN